MAYFLRFTNTANEDLERGTSLLDLPSLDKPVVLDGLCGYSFCTQEEIDYNILSDEEIEAKVNMYKRNSLYEGDAVLFEGKYVDNNPNGKALFLPLTQFINHFKHTNHVKRPKILRART